MLGWQIFIVNDKKRFLGFLVTGKPKRGFWQIETETVPKRFLVVGSFWGFWVDMVVFD